MPPPGRTELTIDRSFTWAAHAEMPEDERPVGAYYTLRHWRPDVHELDILCVLHGDAGPASAWAGRARSGDPVALWAPAPPMHHRGAPPGTSSWPTRPACPRWPPSWNRCPTGRLPGLFAEVAGESKRHAAHAGDPDEDE